MLRHEQSNSLLNYARTKDEYQLVLAMEKPNLQLMDGTESMPKLIDVLAKWRWMSGVSSNNQSEEDIAKELVLIADFVFRNYPKLSIEEISLSIDLSLTNTFDIDVNAYNSFSPMYVSRILNAYLEYKRGLYNTISAKKDLEESRKYLEKKPTPLEKMNSMVELIKYFYDEYKSIGEVKDHFNAIYHFLKRTNRISLSKEIIDEALKYGKERSANHVSTHWDMFDRNKPDGEDIVKRFARNYCVQKIFDTIDIEDFCSKIKLEEFE